VASSLLADSWPRFRGPNGAGVAEGKDIPSQFDANNGILWKLALPGTGNASPVVWDNLLFLHTSSKDAKQRSLLCIDVNGPKILWERSVPGHAVKFRGESSHASATPVIDGANVYNVFWDGDNLHLHAFTFKGEELWKQDLGKFVSQHGPGASPILYRDKLYFANDMDGKSTLLCFDKKSGRKLWEKERSAFRACYSAPFIQDGSKGNPDELIITSTTCITSYHPETGDVNWNHVWDWSVNLKKGKEFPLRTVCSSMILDGVLYTGSGDGGGDRYAMALDLKGAGKDARPARIWDNRKDFPYVPCLLNRADHLYFVNDAGMAGCYHARTGKRVWLERLSDAKVSSSPILVGDRVFLANDTGEVFCFAADTKFNLLGRSDLGQQVRATPAVADGKMYIRGNTHLFCVGKKD
jgi:outer membrane protein assembly factor BamB